jgi:hypothetical protein
MMISNLFWKDNRFSIWVREFSFPQKGGFYYYELDRKTGLNTDVPVDRHQSIPRRSADYNFNRKLVHKTVFDEKGWLYRPTRAICRKISGTSLEKLFTQLEYLIKFIGEIINKVFYF